MTKLLRILFHLLPVLPWVLGFRFGAIAIALLVGLCYVKVFKLRQQIMDYKAQAKECSGIEKTLSFWQNLTFLK